MDNRNDHLSTRNQFNSSPDVNNYKHSNGSFEENNKNNSESKLNRLGSSYMMNSQKADQIRLALPKDAMN